MDNFIDKIDKINNFMKNDAPHVVGTEAVKHFKQSFHDEAFSDKSSKDMPWQEVKRRKNAKKSDTSAGARRKILTGKSGDLGDSITYSVEGNVVNITSDKVYAEVHNKGLKAGRGKGFTMPKRQFIGIAVLLKRKWTTKINKFLKAL
jgi:phage gpG-like protein